MDGYTTVGRSDFRGNRYRLAELLGSGGMGQVYRAVDRLTGEVVALKRLPPSLLGQSNDRELRVALAHEFQALAGLRHPNIITVRDYGFSGSATPAVPSTSSAHLPPARLPDTGRAANAEPYFTMDLLFNPRTIVTAGQFLAIDEQLQLLVPVLHALSYLHRRGTIHRDLKPGNILVSGRAVKVLDFGLAALAGQSPPSAGTLRYMAPELLRGEAATVQSDLYAFGVIAYELFVGWHPYAATGQVISPEQLAQWQPDWSYVDLAPALVAVLQQLLARTPEQRYPDAPSVIHALAAATNRALPLETELTRESFLQAAPFVGRSTELQRLQAAVERARTGHSSFALIGGESGVGKSRLVQEVRTGALVQGLLVLRGQATSDGGAAYQLWREPLRWLALLSAPDALEAAVLQPLVPDIAELLERPVAQAPLLETKAATTRLFTTVSDLLRRSAMHSPLLLLLEDLHWADEQSLALLQWLNRTLIEQTGNGCALVIVATYRRGETPTLPERFVGAELIQLPRLVGEQIAQLSVAMLGAEGARPRVVDFLQRETEGNTFFVVEILRALAEEAGRLDQIGTMTLPQQILPGGIQQVVQRRLRRVPAQFQPALQLAAVAGRQLDLAVLQRAAEQVRWTTLLDSCVNAAVLEWQDNHWQFTHDKLRDGLLTTLSTATQQRYHQQIGEALESVYVAQLAPHYAALAFHFGQADDQQRERAYLQLAGEMAKTTYANGAAIDFYARLLHRLESAPPPVSSADQAEIERLHHQTLLAQGDVLQLVGRWDEAEQHFQQTLHLSRARQHQQTAVQSLYALGLLQRVRGDFAGALGYLQEAEALALVAQANERVDILLEVGNVYYLQGNYTEARRYLQKGLTVAEAQANQSAVAAAFQRLGSIHFSQGNYAGARTDTTRAWEIYQLLDNKLGMANALNNLANIDRSVGDYVTAQSRRVETLTLRRAIGDQWGVAASLNNLAVIPYIQGDFTTARHYWQESLTLRNTLGDRWGAGQTLDNLGLVFFSEGEYPQACQYHEQSLALRRQLGDRWGVSISLSNLAHAELYRGRLTIAQTHYRESLALCHELDDKRGMISCCLGLAGVLVAATPSAEPTGLTVTPSAAQRATQLLAFAHRLTVAIGVTLEQDEQRLYQQIESISRHLLLPPHFTTAWAAGSAFTEEQIVQTEIVAII